MTSLCLCAEYYWDVANCHCLFCPHFLNAVCVLLPILHYSLLFPAGTHKIHAFYKHKQQCFIPPQYIYIYGRVSTVFLFTNKTLLVSYPPSKDTFTLFFSSPTSKSFSQQIQLCSVMFQSQNKRFHNAYPHDMDKSSEHTTFLENGNGRRVDLGVDKV